MPDSHVDDAEFESSRLGTKEHWDHVYEKEVNNFEEFGDEGEVWFGEDSVEEMVEWCVEHVPPRAGLRCLDVGTGNGSLLFALAESDYDPEHLVGIDYSDASIKLAEGIAASRGFDPIRFVTKDFLNEPIPFPSTPSAPDTPSSPENDESGAWDLLLDKGTFDAIALAEPLEDGSKLIDKYPARVEAALRVDGYFLITSCNFTEEELKEKFASSNTSLKYHSKVKRPTFSFGGHAGSTITTLAFQKVAAP